MSLWDNSGTAGIGFLRCAVEGDLYEIGREACGYVDFPEIFPESS